MERPGKWIRGMSEHDSSRVTTSDEELVQQARLGDQRAFAELWRRHFRSGARVARQFTSSIDADDLVSEAYTRIYQRVLAGGGPSGAFRPYLYTTIRNLASTWGAASRDVQVEEIEDFEDPTTLDDPAALALDRTLTSRAFRSLPERWQSVLWYTEVEGMDPHEVAPILGMTANGVAALSYRAREGLRKAWLQAHINDASASGECQWTISRIGDHARNGLTPRDAQRMSDHLLTCAKCSIISEEVDEVGSRLALVMLPIVLGGVAGGTLLASIGHASVATAAEIAIPALPHAFAAGGAASAGIAGLLGSAAAPVALVGTLALAVAVSGSAIVLAPPVQAEGNSSSYSTTEPTSAPVEAATEPMVPIDPKDAPSATDPTNLLDPVTGLVSGIVDPVTGVVGGVVGDVGGIVDGVVGTITDPNGSVADISVSLSGTGTPGAAVSLQALGQVYASTTVDANGNFTLSASAIPGGLASLDLVQTVDRSYLASLLPGGGVLAKLLGTLDGLVNALIKPLQLSSGGSSISINLLG